MILSGNEQVRLKKIISKHLGHQKWRPLYGHREALTFVRLSGKQSSVWEAGIYDMRNCLPKLLIIHLNPKSYRVQELMVEKSK